MDSLRVFQNVGLFGLSILYEAISSPVALEINLVFDVNISSNIKYSNKLVFDLVQKYEDYYKGSTLADWLYCPHSCMQFD